MMNKVKIILFVFSIIIFDCSNFLFLKVPEIIKIYPENTSINIFPDVKIKIFFSKEMDHRSCENAFELSYNNQKLDGDFSWDHNVLVFLPKQKLKSGYKYFISMKKIAKDSKGRQLKQNYLTDFVVGIKDVFPVVTDIEPRDSQIVLNDKTNIVILFSKEMNKKSVEDNFSITPGVEGVFSWLNAYKLKFTQISKMTYSTEYKIKINKGVLDIDNYEMQQDFISFFIFGTNFSKTILEGVYQYGDISQPVSLRFFSNNQQGVSKFSDLVFLYNNDLDFQSFKDNFSIAPNVEGSFEKTSDIEGYKIIFKPEKNFYQNTKYYINISQGVKDIYQMDIDSFNIYFVVNGGDSVAPEIISVIDSSNNLWQQGDINNFLIGPNDSFNLTVTFSPSYNAEMDIISVQNNISISRMAGTGDQNYSALIRSFSWNTDNTKLDMTVSLVSSNNYYKLIFNSSSDGIKDSNDNYIQKDIFYIFYISGD